MAWWWSVVLWLLACHSHDGFDMLWILEIEIEGEGRMQAKVKLPR
jgi:hypothetical protein